MIFFCQLPEERKLDLLKNLAECSPYVTPQDSRQLLPSVVQVLKVYLHRCPLVNMFMFFSFSLYVTWQQFLFKSLVSFYYLFLPFLINFMDSLFTFPQQKHMVRRKIEEMNFTYIECLLYIFHHLAHKVSILLFGYRLFLFMPLLSDLCFSNYSFKLLMPQIAFAATRLSLANLQIGLGKISRTTIKTSRRGAAYHLLFVSISSNTHNELQMEYGVSAFRKLNAGVRLASPAAVSAIFQ